MEIIEVELIKLKPSEYNPRAMTEDEAKELKKSLDNFGLVEPLVINMFPGREFVIIGGHQRYNIEKLRGTKIMSCSIVKLPIEKEKELNLRLNKNNGHWDWDMLANLEKELLEEVGFTEEELIVGFGLNKTEMENVDPDRLQIIEVYPPEAPRLKEKAQIHFEKIEDYQKVKEAILKGVITPDIILGLIK